MNKHKIIYGYTPNWEIFKDKSIEKQVEILKEIGITGVFIAGKNKDFIKEFIKAMHKKGLKVYTSFGCFKGKEAWEEYKETRPVDENGNNLEPDRNYYGVNPAYEPYREKRLLELKEHIEEYEWDGIWLDFIRWPCHWEVQDTYLPKTSFDKYTTDLFQMDCKIKLKEEKINKRAEEILNNYEKQWIQWRCDKITSWVKRAREIINTNAPNKTLGMFSVPWMELEKDNAIIKTIGQDFKELAKYVDVISPMVYHKMCGKSTEWIGDISSYMKEKYDVNILPIIQSVDVPNYFEPEEYEKALNEALSFKDSNGVMIFKLEGIVVNKERLNITTNKFKEY